MRNDEQGASGLRGKGRIHNNPMVGTAGPEVKPPGLALSRTPDFVGIPAC